MKRVLFLCTGNSCRSQMAEGWALHLGMDAFSAGTEPAERVNPVANEAMREKGIDISAHRPKRLEEVAGPFDLVVAVCGHAARTCPKPPPGTALENWNLPDPAEFEGTPEETMEVFRASRDEIERRVRDLLGRV